MCDSAFRVSCSVCWSSLTSANFCNMYRSLEELKHIMWLNAASWNATSHSCNSNFFTVMDYATKILIRINRDTHHVLLQTGTNISKEPSAFFLRVEVILLKRLMKLHGSKYTLPFFFFFSPPHGRYMGLGLLISSRFHDHTFQTHHSR
jgi:hypothetical protein